MINESRAFPVNKIYRRTSCLQIDSAGAGAWFAVPRRAAFEVYMQDRVERRPGAGPIHAVRHPGRSARE